MLNLITPADTLPVDLDDVKAHLGIEHDLDDARINTLIWTAIDYIENETGHSYAAQEWQLVLPYFHEGANRSVRRSNVVPIPRPPLGEVTEVKYYDSADTLQTLDPSQYYVIRSTLEPGYIQAKTVWPVTYCRPDAVQIRFLTDDSMVPATLVHTVKLICGWLNEHREGQAKDIQGIDRLTAQLRDGGYH
jgi:uncharacterized phiE125 gp8 family phage protein